MNDTPHAVCCHLKKWWPLTFDLLPVMLGSPSSNSSEPLSLPIDWCNQNSKIRSRSKVIVRTDRQTDRRTDRRTDGQTDKHARFITTLNKFNCVISMQFPIESYPTCHMLPFEKMLTFDIWPTSGHAISPISELSLTIDHSYPLVKTEFQNSKPFESYRAHRQTDRQTDRRTDGQTDRQTNTPVL